ncbi:uncharacterized protein LOC119603105 [Lucilia sericata]|uniref:uncharacterized protein LOC119603105 n=1 Tax=Lucilia sericata TaxID=13632 RepID=UPI0018A880FA|nr:uncharacterized protein LOC119603105 [Lucilia sericata]
MDKDAQTLANENLYKGGSDCLCALENKSNDNEDKMRSNRGFFKYFGFDSNSKENDKNIAKITKSHKVSANKGENKSKQIGRGKSKASFKIEDKGALVEVKPGTLYDEYMKQIGKIIDVHIS